MTNNTSGAAQEHNARIRPPRRHMLCAPLQGYFKALGNQTPAVIEAPVMHLAAMLDCEHSAASKFVVIAKQGRSGQQLTYVLDVTQGKVYRAEHDTGMVRFWMGVAKRRGPRVVYVDGKGEVPLPAKGVQ